MADKSKKKQIKGIRQNTDKNYTRRGFLKTAGAAATFGAASAFGASEFIKQISKSNRSQTSNSPTGMAAGGQDYEVIEANGQIIRLDDGEVFENKLIDFGDNNDIQISATGVDNVTIRNIGFKGSIPWNEVQLALAANPGGKITVDNIYIGHADDNQPCGKRSMVMWTPPEHAGQLEVRNVYWNVPGNNSTYFAPPNRNGGGRQGSVLIENCYSYGAHHTAFRVTGDNDIVRNSVAVLDSGHCANRGVWVESPNQAGNTPTFENVDVVVRNGGTSFAVQPQASAEISNVNVTPDTTNIEGTVHGEFGYNPEDYVPEGVPTSAEMAASGQGSSGGTGNTGNLGGSSGERSGSTGFELPDEKTITLEGNGNYIIEVNGEIENGDGKIFGNTATGTLNSNTHQYKINGKITDLRAEQDITIKANEEELTKTQIVQLCS